MFTLWKAFDKSVIEICDKDIMLYGKKFIVNCRMDKVVINVKVYMRYVHSHYDLSLNNLHVRKLETYEAEVADLCLKMHL